ncbi:MAG TPA: hypothetical protein VEE84_05325, partial [Burkholderiaceae bacterium]|nr:hypothetical protein [Burkholderiaceae bacterium]
SRRREVNGKVNTRLDPGPRRYDVVLAERFAARATKNIGVGTSASWPVSSRCLPPTQRRRSYKVR